MGRVEIRGQRGGVQVSKGLVGLSKEGGGSKRRMEKWGVQQAQKPGSQLGDPMVQMKAGSKKSDSSPVLKAGLTGCEISESNLHKLQGNGPEHLERWRAFNRNGKAVGKSRFGGQNQKLIGDILCSLLDVPQTS